MKQLPETENALVIRTDFSNESVWQSIRASIAEPVGDFRAHVEFVDDADYADIAKEQVLKLAPKHLVHTFLIIVDAFSISRFDNALLIVDLYDEPGREFRALPTQIQSIENNLSVANMDFEEFAESVDEDGVFRGF